MPPHSILARPNLDAAARRRRPAPPAYRPLFALALSLFAAVISSCAARPGSPAYRRQGDEIMVCGQLFHTGAPVVLWTDPGGYDAYRTEKRFAPLDKSSYQALQKDAKAPDSPERYGVRFFRFAEKQPENWWGAGPLPQETVDRVRGGGWDLPALQGVVDQFVLHYDVCGASRQCFRILHDLRGLSVHFMLDIDGTIYQTLDLKERAWHATVSNDRSIGIEIANMGAYADNEKNPFDRWYARDEQGARITVPQDMGDGGVRTPGFVGRPARPDLIEGEIHGRVLRQYDLTPQQYASLAKLTAALCRVFPNIEPDCPRDAEGRVLTRSLSDPELRAFRGVLGHYHIQEDKADPGPALQWDRVLSESR